jgi:hypothetical protein
MLPLKSSSKNALAGMGKIASATAATNETPNARLALAFMPPPWSPRTLAVNGRN